MTAGRFLLSIGILAAVSLSAQAPKNPAMPRAANGKPDFSGVWQPGSTIPGSWEKANAGTGLGGTGKDPSAPVALASTDRHGEGAPYQDWAAKKVLDSFNSRDIDDPTARCLPAGIPRLYSFGLFPVQIVQSAQQILILYEYMNVFRVIPLNAKHAEDAEPTYLGDSVGRWDGDTLVVDITNFNDKTWLIGGGTFHSDKLHIVERYNRISKDQVNYEAVMEDPEVLTKPWVYRTTMMLREGTRVREYVCPENNLDLDRYEKLLKDGVKINRQ